MLRYHRAIAVIIVLALPLNAASTPQEPAVAQSTVTAKAAAHPPAKKKKKPFQNVRNIPGQIKEMPGEIEKGIRSTSPNSRVQRSKVNVMPPQSPPMPEGPKPDTEPLPSGADRFFNAAAKIMTKSWNGNIFVWLPAISTDPNTGPTIGIMPVLVLSDQDTHHIRHLVAPSYTYNDLFGQTGTVRYYFYPTDTSQMYAVTSVSQHTNREFKVRYENPAMRDGIYYLGTEVYYDADGSQRFYGLGPNTRKGDESGYVAKDSTARVALGVNFFKSWRATFGQRFRRYATEQNIIPNTIDTATRFANTTGLGTNNTVANEFRILWDTRDTPITPSRGASGEAFFEKTNVAWGSDADYIRYGIEGKRLFRWKSDRQITAVHSRYESANGPVIPFYESPSLGGRTSLRGFGERRFVDHGSVVFNVEQRIIFSSLKLMGIQTNFEVAPFFDIGTVFPTLPKIEGKNFRPVYGTAFRAAVKPNVVGDVEVGYGKEGVAVFVDINYPF